MSPEGYVRYLRLLWLRCGSAKPGRGKPIEYAGLEVTNREQSTEGNHRDGSVAGVGAGIVKAFVERNFKAVANSRKMTQSTEVAEDAATLTRRETVPTVCTQA
jgi:hypothetical protein